MREAVYKPIMLTMYSNQPELLESLRTIEPESIRAGEVQQTRHIEDAKFDPAHAAQLAYHVLGVLATAGGAARFIDWVVDKIPTAAKHKTHLVVEVGPTKLEISSSDNPEQVRAKLSSALRMLPK